MRKFIIGIVIAIVFLINQYHSAIAAESADSKINVAVILDEIYKLQGDTNIGTPVSPKELYPVVQNFLNNTFGNNMIYNIQPLKQTGDYALIYRQEHDLMTGGEITDERLNEKSLKTIIAGLQKDDLENICKHFGADYLIYAHIETIKADEKGVNLISASRVNLSIWSNSKNDFANFIPSSIFGYSVLKEFKQSDLNDESRAILKNNSRAIEKEVWAKIEKDAKKIKSVMTR